jgi:hypothetical protein
MNNTNLGIVQNSTNLGFELASAAPSKDFHQVGVDLGYTATSFAL